MSEGSGSGAALLLIAGVLFAVVGEAGALSIVDVRGVQLALAAEGPRRAHEGR